MMIKKVAKLRVLSTIPIKKVDLYPQCTAIYPPTRLTEAKLRPIPVDMIPNTRDLHAGGKLSI